MTGRMCQSMMPEDDVTCLAMAIDIGLMVEMIDVLLVFFCWLTPMRGVEIEVKSAMAFRPDDKSTSSGLHIVYISHRTKMKWMTVGMASGRFLRNITLW